MDRAIAVINAGSSSLKFSLFASLAERPLVHGKLEELGRAPRLKVQAGDGRVLAESSWPEGQRMSHADGLARVLALMPQWLQGHTLGAVGHRIVHGGVAHHRPVRLDETVLRELDALVPLAPLHQPHNLAPVRALMALQPDLPQVGCFDTAFHHGQPELAQRFALPRRYHDAGVRRYGFHGLSYEYVASRLPALDERAAQGRTVVLHLGNGASMCAMQAGRSVASTMGFTALDGLPMGTRCGSIDAGVLLWLMDEQGMGAREIERLLYQESGLLGVSGLSSDMRALLASDHPAAQEAVALYVYRIGQELGALAATLGGLDAIVFTAGIGENAAAIRERVIAGAGWLGARLDASANAAAAGGDHGAATRLHAADSAVSVWVVPTNEEWMIARHTAALMGM